MEANDVLLLLDKRHENDVFISECNTGSTYHNNGREPGPCVRFDAIAIPKIWRPVRVIGYEIKVRRPDFLGDKKWPRYMPFCTEFYFVAPENVVGLHEVPDGCGLIRVSDDGGSVRMAKRSPSRPLEDPGALLSALMWRAKISRLHGALASRP